MKDKMIRVSSFLLLLLLLLPVLLFSFSFGVAAEGQDGIDGYYEDLDQTNIMTDLKKYGVNVFDYAIDQTVKPGSDQDYLTIVRLVEFGYDYKQDLENYGLYVYIYNPTCVDLSTSEWNKIQIAVKKSSGELSPVQKKDLTLIDHSDDHLFYKYRIDGLSDELLRTMAPSKRTYLISGIEFEMPDWTDPHDYLIAGEYTFTGFLKGYGVNKWDAETLYCSVDQKLTIKTELHMTNWRSDRSEKGENYYKDVAGVYFSVPNWILNKYGDEENPLKGLYEVEGEYYEYKLNGLVTTNEDTYDYVSHYECQSFADGISSSDVILSFWTGQQFSFQGSQSYIVDRYYNIDTHNGNIFRNRLNKLGVVFHDDECETVNDVKAIMSRKILDRIEADQSKGEDPYLSYVDPGHIKGYNTYKITAGESETLAKVDTSYSQEHPIKAFFLGVNNTYKDVTVPALQLVNFGAFQSESYITNESAISDDYFLDEKYVSDFVDYVQDNVTLMDDLTGSSVFMMHYSVTDTYIAPTYIHREYDRISTFDAPGDHYYFEQSVFQDFDILSITMKDEYGNTTKIPVVADPKDFTPDLPSVGGVLRPGSKDPMDDVNKEPFFWDRLNTLGKVLVILAAVIVISLVFRLGGPLLKPIGSLFGVIFSGIGSVFRGTAKAISTVFTAREKTYESKRRRIEDRQYDEDRVSRRSREDYADNRRRIVDVQDDEDRVSRRSREDYADKRKRIVDVQDDEDRARRHKSEDLDMTEKRYDSKQKRIKDKQADEDRVRRHKREDLDMTEKRYDSKQKRIKDKQADEDRVRRHKREDLDMTEKRYDSKQKRIKDKQADEDRTRRHKREDLDYKRKETEAFKSDYEFAKKHATKDQPYEGRFQDMGRENDE